jgi:hypothetical protein
MTGDRKLKAFYATMLAEVLLVGTAFVTGVPMSGDNVIAIGTIIAATGGGFFGANFGEHMAKAKAANGQKVPVTGEVQA